MPPIYDDYNDESGFGGSMTLGSNNPTSLEGVQCYDNIVRSLMMIPLFWRVKRIKLLCASMSYFFTILFCIGSGSDLNVLHICFLMLSIVVLQFFFSCEHL